MTTTIRNRTRTFLQIAVLGLILYVAARPLFDKAYQSDFEQYCPFGGLSSFFSKLNLNTMACSMSETQVMLGFALLLGVGFIGKVFCSHICPIGSVTEWIGMLGKKFSLQKEIPQQVDRLLRLLKYILLFVTIYFTMTSSELFCKKYDPFFAAVQGFNNADIVLSFAIFATVLTLGGALFYRMFWCKYLCPLGAFSNIFLNTAFAGTVVMLYAASFLMGSPLHPLWLLIGLIVVGVVTEVGFLRSFLLPIARVTRNEQTCSNCHHCDDHCPQGIKISTVAAVRHIDCHLCTDCAHTCPLKNTLAVNKKARYTYLAPLSALVLIVSALLAATLFEFATISLRWGNSQETDAVFTQSGIKSITCFGSSMALAGTVENIEGITGIDTYAKSHTVKIYYDSSVISLRGVKASLFSSSKIEIRTPALAPAAIVGVLEIGVMRLFDAIDFNDLASLLGELEGVLGFETRFGEPVMATVYYLPSAISPAGIHSQLNRKYILRNGKRIELAFETSDQGRKESTINFAQYQSRIFDGYDDTFNTYEQYAPEKLCVYKFPMPEAADPELKNKLELLAGHLSKDAGVVRFNTYVEGGTMGSVYYDPAKTNEAAIRNALSRDTLTYFVSDTEIEQIPNPFHCGM